LDIYLIVPKTKQNLIEDSSIYIREQILNLSRVNEHIKTVSLAEESLEFDQETESFYNRLSFNLDYIE
jgi:hypothetical protein